VQLEEADEADDGGASIQRQEEGDETDEEAMQT